MSLFTCDLIYERVASPHFLDRTLCTVQLRIGQEVQIFIFARFVHVVSCSKVPDCFVHHAERISEQQGSLWSIFWATKGFWFDLAWGLWPFVDFMYVFLCFIFLSRCYFWDGLCFFFTWIRTYSFILCQKKAKKLIYLCRSDIVPVLVKLDYFVMLAENLPVFLVAYNALEVLGQAWGLVMNGVIGSSACS